MGKSFFCFFFLLGDRGRKGSGSHSPLPTGTHRVEVGEEVERGRPVEPEGQEVLDVQGGVKGPARNRQRC